MKVILKGLIQSYTLTSILENSKFRNKRIDFLNIDVEGADYETLLSLNFEVYRPKIIVLKLQKKLMIQKYINF